MVDLDPTKFQVTPNIPVLDEGDIVTPVDGGETQTFPVTPPILREFRDAMNRREQNSNDLAILAKGHVKRENGVDETTQAPVIGYAKNWGVSKRPTDSKWVLHYDEYLHPEHKDVPKQYPRRSPDVWYQRREIDPVAYLSSTTPHRDLGLHPLSFSRGGETVLRVPYMSEKKDEKPETKGDAKIEGCLNEVVGLLTQLTAKVDALAAPPAAPPTAPAQEPEMSPEEADAVIEQLLGSHDGKDEKEKPKQMARTDEVIAPVADNTAELADLKKKYDEVVIQLARQEMTAKLTAMQTDGYQIDDVEGHVKDLLALPAEMRPVQLSRMEKNYRKAPGAKVNAAIANAAEPGPAQLTDDDVQKVMSLARKDNIRYEDAREKLFPGQLNKVTK